MGQIFKACAYDIDTRTCCVIDADKFDEDGYLLSDSKGTLFESAGINFSLKRTKSCCMKVKADKNGVLYQKGAVQIVAKELMFIPYGKLNSFLVSCSIDVFSLREISVNCPLGTVLLSKFFFLKNVKNSFFFVFLHFFQEIT